MFPAVDEISKLLFLVVTVLHQDTRNRIPTKDLCGLFTLKAPAQT